MDLPNIKEIAPSKSGYPIKDYSDIVEATVSASQYLVKHIEIDIEELLKSAERNADNFC